MRALVRLLPILSAALFLAGPAAAAPPPPDGAVTVYHGDPARRGAYIAPGLTPDAARTLHRDPGFDGHVEGHVYAQPLFWRPKPSAPGRVIVATSKDIVYALDPTTGRPDWTAHLGTPVPMSALGCGDIDPVGVTGTPVIDAPRGALYLDAMVLRDGAPHHLVFALSLADGHVLPGWPLDIGAALEAAGPPFDPRFQNQRAALALLDRRIYVAFGGHSGDCGDYHGIVAAIATDDRPRLVANWHTSGLKGGVWAPGGIGVAHGHLYFATGNTDGATQWADGEAIFRLGPNLARREPGRDVFIPRDWQRLDELDRDLGGTGPLPVDIAGRPRLLAFGKNGVAYLLNRDDLGGFGGEIARREVAHSPIVEAPAVLGRGSTGLVVFDAARALCPDGSFTAGLAALAIGPGSIAPLWCAPYRGRASPVITTTDGYTDPIVWLPGADADRKLHAYDGRTGAPLYESAPMEDKIAPFSTVLVADGRIYLAARGRVAAFTWTK